MVQDKKKFSSGSKKPMSQDLDRKTQSGAADRSDRSATDTARTGNMKQADKTGAAKRDRDIGSRK